MHTHFSPRQLRQSDRCTSSYWFALWFVRRRAMTHLSVKSKPKATPSSSAGMHAICQVTFSRSHQTDNRAKANVEHLLMQPLQICLMRNWFSLLLSLSFFFLAGERGRLSLRHGNSRLHRSNNQKEKESCSPREQAVRSSSRGGMTHRQGHSDAHSDGCSLTLPTTTPGCRAWTDRLLRC